ncbi:S-adenosylmethionine:tRNA ribosyltransferase-isomerase [Actinomadura darangshiensis]|uniref:S-adenosylmethionine:tRNA ribosyltransferase-isomerase n=1 Tax=Actinomadura darangshiensis TaxID=705336 RepID=A0A4R5AJK4_9ACTN|nr:S-adenosylmethionine:tRNA ribosyltransferase-isomerase [Actinomadura darangshiensis]TDD72823.1 S-adenosylmethionine:tRNA ribosyltransferase-isomerase [Actinomadura darangshiensis]
MTVEFTLPAALEAHEPPEERGSGTGARTRDGVRLLVSRRATGEVSHHGFRDLPSLLDPGDLLVVNTSATLPAAVRLDRISVHFSTPVPGADDRLWMVELRRRTGKASRPYSGGCPGEWIPLPGGATLTLVGRGTDRLWQARLSTDVVPYLRRHGVPIRYGYVRRDWPAAAYQTVFAHDRSTGSAEMPSAARPFTAELVTRLVSGGVLLAPITLHTGVASPEAHEPPYAERYAVPEPTAALVEHVRSQGRRVIAVGTTAVRALETSVDASGHVQASSGWTEHIVTPSKGVRAVDGLLTGLHEPKSSHLMMLTAIAGHDLLTATYEAALAEGYLWHEFGDLNLLMNR